MRDYKFNHQELFTFSHSDPYGFIDEQYHLLFDQLNELQVDLNFPAIHDDVGAFISFMLQFWNPKVIYEMGSGYGHSAFWYLLANNSALEKVVLTERRADLKPKFEHLAWPKDWNSLVEYNNADAFDVLDTLSSVDFALIDGVKGDYLKCLKILEGKMKPGGVVLIDNSYWRGSFLNEDLRKYKISAQNIFELHEYIKESKRWKSVFIPFIDGLTILTLN
jgi:predicted O-methyltransferase YrrM